MLDTVDTDTETAGYKHTQKCRKKKENIYIYIHTYIYSDQQKESTKDDDHLNQQEPSCSLPKFSLFQLSWYQLRTGTSYLLVPEKE